MGNSWALGSASGGGSHRLKSDIFKVLCRGGGSSLGHPAMTSCKPSPSSGGRAQSPSFYLSMAGNMICIDCGDPPPSTAIASPIGYLTASWQGSRTFLIIFHRAKA